MPADPDRQFDVSIVVPVGRYDDMTQVQLDAIRGLDTGGLDVELVLSSNSGRAEDETALREATSGDFPFPTTVVDSSAVHSAAHSRNAGAAVARGRVLAFCDADDVVEPGWLVAIVAGLEHHDAVSGHLEELVDRESDRGLRPPATPGDLPTYLGVPYLLSGNLAIGASLFREIGGFDETLIRCEDTALSWKLLDVGHSIGYVADAVVHYRMRSGVWLMMKQHFMYGRGAAQMLVRYGIPRPYRQQGEKVRLLKPNGQPGGRGSWVRFLRRAAIASGRVTGILEERWVTPRRAAAAATEIVPVDPVPPPRDARVLWVADAGGHLLEGWIMRELLYPDLDVTWYTADTVMSRSLLEGQPTRFARRRVLPRRPDLATREFFVAWRELRRMRPDVVISTGSAVALPWLTAAVLQRRRAIFHESAARYRALSLTGKLVDLVPGVERYTQTPIRKRGWQLSRSTLELASRVGAAASADRTPGSHRLFVTVGTHEYPFQRLFRRLEQVVPDDWDIIWQIGHAGGYRPARGVVVDFLPYEEMLSTIRSSDVVITHAGVGSILTALQAGRLPVVVPRRVSFGEIADDHQLEVLELLRANGITAFDDVSDVTAEVFTKR